MGKAIADGNAQSLAWRSQRLLECQQKEEKNHPGIFALRALIIEINVQEQLVMTLEGIKPNWFCETVFKISILF